MIEPNKNAHLLSDLLKKVDEMKPNNEAGFQVSLSSCFKKKFEAFFKPIRGANDSWRRTITNGNDAFRLNCGWCHFERVAAFTLAEVLITLGIIGVVAAMTIPTVINATNGAQYKTAFKKALSVMAQAVEMNKALNDYDLSQTIAGTNPAQGANGSVQDGEAQTIYSIFRNRLNVVKVANGEDFNVTRGDPNYYPVLIPSDQAVSAMQDLRGFGLLHGTTLLGWGGFVLLNNSTGGKPDAGTVARWDGGSTFLFLNDGITLIFNNMQSNCRQATANLEDNYCFGYIDVNGQKGPNKLVECDKGSEVGDIGTDDYTCTVSNPTDIYPVAMYNETIIPASAAARAVLFSK